MQNNKFNKMDIERVNKLTEILKEDDDIVIEAIEVEKMSFKKDVMYDIDELQDFVIATIGFVVAAIVVSVAFFGFITQ